VDVGVSVGVDVGVSVGVDVGVPVGVVPVGVDVGVSVGGVTVGVGPAGPVSLGPVPAGVQDAPVATVGVVVAGVTVQADADAAGGSGAPVVPGATRADGCRATRRVVPSADEVAPGANAVGAGFPVGPDVGGWHWADDVPGAAPPGPPLEPEALVGLGWGAAVTPPPASRPVPSVVVCAPAPLVPAPGGDRAPAGSSTALAAVIARRTGWTPRETLAMTAMPARPVASQSTPMRQVPSAPGTGNVRVSSRPGQAQCPRQVQDRTRSAAPDRTASSQGRGGRPPMRARIRSSPSVPASTPPTASDRARRSAPSSPSSSEDGSSSTGAPDHGVFCSRVDLSAAIARAV